MASVHLSHFNADRKIPPRGVSHQLLAPDRDMIALGDAYVDFSQRKVTADKIRADLEGWRKMPWSPEIAYMERELRKWLADLDA